MDDETLLARAAAGDRAAAGVYLARHLPLLAAAARKLADSRHDPDDLLAEAIASLLARWAEGAVIESPRSYLMQSMRNSIIDAARSPRSKVTELDVDLSDPLLPDHDSHLELENEIEWLRIALDRIPDSQRELLVAQAGGVSKRIEPALEPDRSRGAGYSLKSRARQSLRRAYLQVILEEGAPPSCQHAIAALPQHVADSPDETIEVPAHIRECERCRKRWRVFAGIASTLGIASLVVVSDALRAAPASAASTTNIGPQIGDAGAASAGGTGSAATHSLFTAKKLILAGSAILATGVALTVIAIVSTLGAVPDAESLAQTKITGVVPDAGRTEQPSDGTDEDASAELHYSISTDSNSSYALALDLRVAGADWVTQSLDFALPEGISIDAAPAGWRCSGSSCTTAEMNAAGGIFALQRQSQQQSAGGEGNGAVEIRWSSLAGGQSLYAVAGSSLPPTGKTYSTSAQAQATQELRFNSGHAPRA